MVKTDLSLELIKEGAVLIEALDQRGAVPDAAFWLYFPETAEWKLMLMEVKRSPKGPRAIYQSIQKAFRAVSARLPNLSFNNIMLVKPDAFIVRALSAVLHTGPGISGIRFSGNMVNGVWIEDAYIYRLPTRPRRR